MIDLIFSYLPKGTSLKKNKLGLSRIYLRCSDESKKGSDELKNVQ